MLLRLRLPDEPSALTSRLFVALIQAFRVAKTVDPEAAMRVEHDEEEES